MTLCFLAINPLVGFSTQQNVKQEIDAIDPISSKTITLGLALVVYYDSHQRLPITTKELKNFISNKEKDIDLSYLKELTECKIEDATISYEGTMDAKKEKNTKLKGTMSIASGKDLDMLIKSLGSPK